MVIFLGIVCMKPQQYINFNGSRTKTVGYHYGIAKNRLTISCKILMRKVTERKTVTDRHYTKNEVFH